MHALGAVVGTRSLLIALWRWFHLLAGLVWIGLLYYFNFVQTPSFAEMEAPARTNAQQKLLPRALLWFRMAAATTFVTGILIWITQENYKGGYMKTASGLSILAGMFIATIMMLNVWLVIWPNQKVVIANAGRVAAGQDPDPNAATAGRKGALASRTNTLFSIPVMWFMIGTSHFAPALHTIDPGGGKRALWYIVVLVLTLLLEANALGMLGGFGPSPIRKYMDDHRQTIIVGFVLWAVFFVVQLIVGA